MNTSIFQGKNGQWYFHFVGLNGEVMAASEGYTRKSSAKRALARFIAKVKLL